jgi:hypothetical protein
MRIINIITNNTHLIEGSLMPQQFRGMLSYGAAYQIVMKKWQDNPPKPEVRFDEAIRDNTSLISFPSEFPGYVREMFNQLKLRQTTLLK